MVDVRGLGGLEGATAQGESAGRPSGERWAVLHEAHGGTTLGERLQARHPTLLGLEATGGLERLGTSA